MTCSPGHNRPHNDSQGGDYSPQEAKQGSQEQEGGDSVIRRETTRRPKRERASLQHYRDSAILERETEPERSHYCRVERPEHCIVSQRTELLPRYGPCSASCWSCHGQLRVGEHLSRGTVVAVSLVLVRGPCGHYM